MDETQPGATDSEVIDGGAQPSASSPHRIREIGLLLLGGGALSALVTLLRTNRKVEDWALPVALAAAGSALLIKRRHSDMERAQEAILSELDQLDPIAKAQVLKAVGQKLTGHQD